MRAIPVFVGTCVGLPVEDLEAFDDSSKEISYRTFRRAVGRAVVAELNATFGVPLSRDWAVRFTRGLWRGRQAVCLFHSAIHHIWELVEPQ